MEQILLGSILSISFADDLKNRKVHNFLILSFLFVSFSYFIVTSSFTQIDFRSLVLCSAVVLPLVYLRILGAGDYKLLMVIALFLAPMELGNLMILSLVWNALAGLIKYSTNRFTKLESSKQALSFPFTFGISLAWLSLAFLPQGVSLW